MLTALTYKHVFHNIATLIKDGDGNTGCRRSYDAQRSRAKNPLAPRTVRYALKKLKERHLIIEKFNFRDARQIIYQNRTTQTTKPQSVCV